MIIELIWLMFTLAFALLFLGYNIKVPYVVMMGWIMIFLLSLGFSSAGIEYETGVETYYVYGSYYGGYHWDYNGTQPNKIEPDLFHTVEENIYSVYTNTPIFLYLALISGLGFVSVFYTKDLW